MKVFTDLDLNKDTPARVQPEIGEWGPTAVMRTARKKLLRWLWPLGFVAIATGMFFFGHWVFGLIMTSGG